MHPFRNARELQTLPRWLPYVGPRVGEAADVALRSHAGRAVLDRVSAGPAPFVRV
jgi:hypothetical protein